MGVAAPAAMDPRRPHRWPNEIELLLACARRAAGTPDVERARRALASGIDWNRLAGLAAAHRLVPLVSRFLDGQDMGPDAVRAALRARAAANARRSLLHASELLKLLDLGETHGIGMVPLKGLPLAESVYGSISLRQINDIDLLLEPADIPRLIALLAGTYAHSVFNPVDVAPLIQRHGNHLSLVNRANGVLVELHHRLLLGRMRGGTLAWLAPRLSPARLMGRTMPAMADEDQFVYLCAHGAAHAWSRIEWIAAIAELLRAGRVRDWHRARACAADLGAWPRVQAAVLLARELFEADLAAGVDLGAPSARLTLANAQVIAHLVTEPERTLATSDERERYQGHTDPRWSWVVRRRWWRIGSPQLSDTEFWRLPRLAWPLYAIARPIRLIARRAGLLRGERRR